MSRNWSNPPRWPQRLLQWLCSEEHFEILQGDLFELYEYRLIKKGKTKAKLHFIKDSFDMLRPFALKNRKRKLKNNSYTMFKNYIKIGWRNIIRYKSHSTINILGLAFGLACCIIIFRYVSDEMSYDKFHEKADRIYRITYSTNDDGSPSNANGSFGPAPAMANDFPEVEAYTRLYMIGRGKKLVMQYDQKRFYEDRLFFVDASFFDVFSFEMVQGDSKTALKNPNSVVISKSTAKKYFGDTNPMGKFLESDVESNGQKKQYTITGVVEDTPSNSHFKFDVLASMSSLDERLSTAWGGFWQTFSYIALKPNADEGKLIQSLENYSEKYMGVGQNWYQLGLQPLLNIHLGSNLKSEILPTSSYTKVIVFSAVGVLIFVIACINFLTLSTARSSRRAREIGVRKTFGAYRNQLFGQFMSEAMLNGAIATGLALFISYMAFPFINSLSDKNLSLAMENGIPELVLIATAAILLVTFMAGLYPAIFLSSFKPITALRGVVSNQGRIGGIRKILVVFQFTISIALIIGSLVVERQMDFMRSQSLTKSGDQVIVLPINEDIRKNLEAYEASLSQIPSVKSFSGTSKVPTRGSSSDCFSFGEDKRGCAFYYLADFDYPKTMDYQLLAGRLFDKNIGTDSVFAFIINEAALEEFELGTAEEAIGKPFARSKYETGRVIGVVENFHVYSLHRTFSPSWMLVTPKVYYQYFAVRISNQNVSQTLEMIGDSWADFSPEAPFDYFFLDEAFANLHLEDIRTGKVVSAMTFIAILIAAIGLFGLASFMSEQRAKEIGIRKVLGASVLTILNLMSKSYLKLILTASVIAIPLSYWLLNEWLASFEYSISFGPLVFVASILIVGLVVLTSISYQSIKAATMNPIESLRNE